MKILILSSMLLAAWASADTLEGRIWDTRSRTFISADAAYWRAAASHYVLLGEQHDSAPQHQLQLEALQALAKRGRKPALAMEQFDREHQAALSAAQAAGATDPERLADAGQLNRKGWRWPMYKDLIAFAASNGWPLLAANLSRNDARAIAMGQVAPKLPAFDAVQQGGIEDAIEDDIVRGHCGHRPPPGRLAAMVTAQRARDVRMAEALDSVAGPVVLIAGVGHVRRDRAVPRYLRDRAAVLSIGYVEVDDGKPAPEAYDGAGLDLLWFTAGSERSDPDPCAEPLTGSAAPVGLNQSKENP